MFNIHKDTRIIHGWEPARVEFHAGARQGDGVQEVIQDRLPWAPAGSLKMNLSALPLKVFACLCLLVMAFSACTKDAPEVPSLPDTGQEVDNDGDKFIVLQLPSKPRTATYAVSENVENTIDEVDLLVYKVDAGLETFLYRTVGKVAADLNSDGSQKKIRVLVKNTEPGENVRFVLFANLHSELDSMNIQIGDTKESLYDNFDIPVGKWNAKSDSDFRPLPMWGETSTVFPIGDNTHSFPTIKMMRSLARVDIGLMFSEFFDEPVGLGDDFVLNEVHVFNMVDRAKVVPYKDSIGSEGVVKGVSMPSSTYTNTLSYSYTQDEIREMKSLQRTIYVAEQEPGSVDSRETSPCVVLGGTIKGKPMTFYRVDFLLSQGPVSASDPDARDIYLPLLRNYRYILNVVKVDNIGYNTVHDAFTHNPINTIQIKEIFYNEFISSLSYDGNYMLAMEEYQFKWDYDAFACRSRMYTDHEDGWDATVPEEYQDWLHIQSGDHGRQFQYDTIQLLVDQNTTGGNRSGYVLITFGRLEEKLWVYQTNETERTGNANIVGMQNGNNATQYGDGRDFTYEYAIMNMRLHQGYIHSSSGLFYGKHTNTTGYVSLPWGTYGPRPMYGNGNSNSYYFAFPWMENSVYYQNAYLFLGMTFSTNYTGSYSPRNWEVEFLNPADTSWVKLRNTYEYHYPEQYSDPENPNHSYYHKNDEWYLAFEAVKAPNYSSLQTGNRTAKLLFTYDGKYKKTFTIHQDVPYFTVPRGHTFVDRNNKVHTIPYSLMTHTHPLNGAHYDMNNVMINSGIQSWYHFANVPDYYNGDPAQSQVSPARLYSCAWLNEEKFAGFTDWRLPTIEEASHLIAFNYWTKDPVLWKFFFLDFYVGNRYQMPTSENYKGMEEYFTILYSDFTTDGQFKYSISQNARCVRTANELDQ